MKKTFLAILVCLCFWACDKNFNVEKDMYFEQTNWNKPKTEMVSGGAGHAGVEPMHLELRTDGRAFLYPGSGDIVWDGTYKIKSRKVVVSLNYIQKVYEFDIKSLSELLGSDGEQLRIKK